MNLENTPDEVLLRRMTSGDERAFVTLYRRRQGGIYRFALQMSGSHAIAEDVTQEVFIAIIRGTALHDPARGSVSSFLYGVARNHVLRCLERDRANVPIAEEQEAVRENTDLLADLARNQTVAAVRQAVLALPAHYREVVVLCELQEMDYMGAAAALGCAVGTVRSRLHRARGLLLEKLRASKVAPGCVS